MSAADLGAGGPASSPSAAATGSPRPSARRAGMPANSPPSSRSPTTAARAAGCASSSASRRRATSGAASARCCRRRRRSATRSSTASNPASSTGHAFGNLLIAALAATTGDFVAGVDEAARVLGTVGRVLPATEVPVVLKAQMASGELVGQVAISRRRGCDGRARAARRHAAAGGARGDRRGGPDRHRPGIAVHERARRLRRSRRSARRCPRRPDAARLRRQPARAGPRDGGLRPRAATSPRCVRHGVPVDVVLADTDGAADRRVAWRSPARARPTSE